MWKETSEEDWELCENNQVSLRSRAYEPGPLSPLTEHSVTQFENWYPSRPRVHETPGYARSA